MEALKAIRDQIRRLYRRTAQETIKRVKENQVENLVIDLKYLDEKYEEIKTLDKKIQDILDFSVLEELEFEREYDEADELLKLHLEVTVKGKELLVPKVKVESEIRTKEVQKQNLKVPKLILREFNDDPKDWIGFWGQFKKINDDNEISEEDKFQYLIQSLAPGSASRKLIESYPPSQENYPKALNELKAKYSNDILIEVYIRELLRLMFSATSVQMKVSELYNNLNTYVQALGLLGIDKEKYQCILYPLIESALPGDVLVSYDRSQLGHNKHGSERLDALMSFLQREVITEDRIKMARAGMTDLSEGPAFPTAAFVSKQKEQVRSFTNIKKDCCVYCEGVSHSVNECRKFGNLSLEEMKGAIKVKNACYFCLKKGHMAKFCKTFVKCMACGKRHTVLLCPELHRVREKCNTVSTDEHCEKTDDSTRRHHRDRRHEKDYRSKRNSCTTSKDTSRDKHYVKEYSERKTDKRRERDKDYSSNRSSSSKHEYCKREKDETDEKYNIKYEHDRDYYYNDYDNEQDKYKTVQVKIERDSVNPGSSKDWKSYKEHVKRKEETTSYEDYQYRSHEKKEDYKRKGDKFKGYYEHDTGVDKKRHGF